MAVGVRMLTWTIVEKEEISFFDDVVITRQIFKNGSFVSLPILKASCH